MSKNKNNNKKQQSFFDQQLQKYGPKWIYLLNSDQIRKNALKIFKDLAYGNVDPYEVSEYFSIPDFTYNLKIAADDNAIYNWYTYLGLSNMVQSDSALYYIATSHYEAYNAFTAASLALNNILTSLTLYGPLYTTSLLMQTINILMPYKYNFNGYFITINRDNDKRIKLSREIGGNYINDQRSSNKSEDPFWNQSD